MTITIQQAREALDTILHTDSVTAVENLNAFIDQYAALESDRNAFRTWYQQESERKQELLVEVMHLKSKAIEAEADRDRLQSRLDEAVRLMGPFAKMAEKVVGKRDGTYLDAEGAIKVSDLRAAANFVKEQANVSSKATGEA